MKRVTLLTALVSACLVAASFAMSQAAGTQYFAGIVLTVNARSHSIAVTEAGRGAGQMARTRMTFVVEPSTNLSKNQQAIELSGIQRGDPVAIEYVTSGNNNLAQTIEVLTTPAR
jgi:Cu/Ag efflux protein CusF